MHMENTCISIRIFRVRYLDSILSKGWTKIKNKDVRLDRFLTQLIKQFSVKHYNSSAILHDGRGQLVAEETGMNSTKRT